MKQILDNKLGFLAASMLFSCIAYANAGVPMLFVVMPAYGLSLIPIIVVEAAYLKARLEISVKDSAALAIKSNLASTIVGVPLTWFFLVVLQIATGGGSGYGLNTVSKKIAAVTWQAPWLFPYEEELDWMVPIAGAVLLVPFYFASWWTEYRVCKKLMPGLEAKKINIAVRNANLITYSFLMLWPAYYYLNPKG